mgnify:CR=1 FL=1
MATTDQVKHEIRSALESQGFSISLLREWPAKATYYRANGEPLPNLPADPWSMRKYLARGLTLQPPKLNPGAGVVEVAGDALGVVGVPFPCPEPGCSFSAQTRSGLESHSKKHTRALRSS